MSVDKIIKDLQNPPREFSPVPFWLLNDRLEKAEIRRQIEDFNNI